jgi:hypothetical protein
MVCFVLSRGSKVNSEPRINQSACVPAEDPSMHPSRYQTYIRIRCTNLNLTRESSLALRCSDYAGNREKDGQKSNVKASSTVWHVAPMVFSMGHTNGSSRLSSVLVVPFSVALECLEYNATSCQWHLAGARLATVQHGCY